MKEFFKDILGLNGVAGVILFGPDGSILYQSPVAEGRRFDIRQLDFQKLATLLARVREADLVFQGGRIYVRKAEIGFMLIVLEAMVSIAMVKLNCDILLPMLKPDKVAKARKSFFRKG
jgi:hypothetical protein